MMNINGEAFFSLDFQFRSSHESRKLMQGLFRVFEKALYAHLYSYITTNFYIVQVYIIGANPNIQRAVHLIFST